jgi:hypothetical protein
MEKRSKGSVADDLAVASYRLMSIDRSGAPSGATGDDWLVYRISQGGNIVTGYRQGRRHDVSVALEHMVQALNDRLLVKGRPYRLGRPQAASAADMTKSSETFAARRRSEHSIGSGARRSCHGNRAVWISNSSSQSGGLKDAQTSRFSGSAAKRAS